MATDPYLAVDLRLGADRKAGFATLPRPRIGLCWQGGRDHSVDKDRSIRLGSLRPLLSSIQASWVSLHKEDDRGEIAAAGLEGLIRSVAGELNDFADTAAVIDNLDLVISVDTAVAHLAGAIGKPVWLLIPTPPDYRWLLARPDSPWYPRHRLFRQNRPGDWQPVIAAVAAALTDL
jgi:ADP-heptose:LPS heptosyltransferase